MFITVKYGHNESLVCNPSCAVVNLLNSIKRRTGYGNTPVLLDLSDETGLVKELDAHRLDYASKHLTSHSTYVLVEKQLLLMEDDIDISIPPQYNYIPLLENHAELFPNFKLHVNVELEVKKKRRAAHSKSPSPAGIRGIKGNNQTKTARPAPTSRSNSRRR